jgi:phosphoglycerate dehydrogenase-like enzyme
MQGFLEKMTEVLITFPIADELVNRLRGISPQLHMTVYPAQKAEDISNETWGKTEILFTDDVVPVPEKAPHLKWIQFLSAGLDDWASNEIFSKPGLLITNLSGAGASQMAEHVLMMMLALSHKLPSMMAHQRKSDWPKDRIERFQPIELRDATVGIVGYGSIGRQIARLLEPFGMTVLASKRDAKSPDDPGYSREGLGDPNGNFVHRLYPAEALQPMLKISDFIVVCVPLTSKTRGLFGSSTFSNIKTGAYLIDVSRGKVIDHASLIKALQDESLAGVALDVFPEEPLPAESPLWGMPNVIITPHIADNSPHFEQRACELFSENLHRFLAGLPLYNLYNPEWGY